MVVTDRELNRSTLDRQLLLGRAAMTAVDALDRVVAIQAQEAASPYVALWNRISGFDPHELDRAFAERVVVKAPLMRITLHAVTAVDYATLHQAMLPTLRAARLGDRRFAASGLTIADADALVDRLVTFTSEPRTKDEIESMLADELGAAPEQGVWWALRTYAPLHHAPTGEVWSFGRSPVFVAAPEAPRPEPDEALRHLVRRYLEGFGPARAEDVAQFALRKRSDVRAAIDSMSDELEHLEGPGGATYYDVPGAETPDGDVPAPPRLMAMWDSTLLAYADRSRIIPEPYRQVVTRRNGDVLPTLLVDGQVCGVWRHVDGAIEATAFQDLDPATWEGLEAEAAALLTFLADRDPAVYGRFTHWWSKLPPGEVRRLPG